MKGIRRIFLNRESDIIIIIDKIIQRSGRNVLENIHSSTRKERRNGWDNLLGNVVTGLARFILGETERERDRERNAWMPRRLTPQSTVNDFQWRLDVSITLWLAESDADIRTNGQWESAKCSRCAFNPVNTSGVYWGFHPAITVNDGTYETLFIRRVCSLHRSCKYSVAL